MVAVKVLEHLAHAENPDSPDKEAILNGQLSHPNIVSSMHSLLLCCWDCLCLPLSLSNSCFAWCAAIHGLGTHVAVFLGTRHRVHAW